MSEWEYIKEEGRQRKERNKDWSTNRLKQLGIEFESCNDGVHLIVSHNGKVADFWPSTGKYKLRDQSEYKRGIKKLIKDLMKNNLQTKIDNG